jgi:hypothetical protein
MKSTPTPCQIIVILIGYEGSEFFRTMNRFDPSAGPKYQFPDSKSS